MWRDGKVSDDIKISVSHITLAIKQQFSSSKQFIRSYTYVFYQSYSWVLKSSSKWAFTLSEASQSISIVMDVAWSEIKD